ncbi:TPA: glycosyltransferase, partial [Vibrio metschnikovii]
NLLTVAYPYLHKNVTVFKEVSDILSSDEREYIFYITVPDDYYKSNFSGYEGKIINLGLVKNSECPELYLKSDAMILPSLVECFSASYPEAMKMMRPILTSNYSFAQSICGDAAIYFNPLAPDDIAKKIRLLANDEKVYEELVLNGVKRLNCFLSPSERCNQYLYLMKNMVGNNV